MRHHVRPAALGVVLVLALLPPTGAQETADAPGASADSPQDGWPPEGMENLSADDFGTFAHYLILGAPDFRPLNSTITWEYDGLGSLYRTGGDTTFWAPVHLPTGALMDEVCFYGYDSSAALNFTFDFGVYEVGSNPAHANILAPTASTGWTGYSFNCQAINHAFSTFGDLNDGISNPFVYRVVFDLTAGDNTQRLSAVRLRWRRVVSTTAGSSYSDVPVGHPYFQVIHALRAAGVTTGCAAGRFCPDNPVTRAQFAYFLARALGLNWQ